MRFLQNSKKSHSQHVIGHCVAKNTAFNELVLANVVRRQLNCGDDSCSLSCRTDTLPQLMNDNVNQGFYCDQSACNVTFHKPASPSCWYTSLKQANMLLLLSEEQHACIRTLSTSVGLAMALEAEPATIPQKMLVIMSS